MENPLYEKIVVIDENPFFEKEDVRAACAFLKKYIGCPDLLWSERPEYQNELQRGGFAMGETWPQQGYNRYNEWLFDLAFADVGGGNG